MENGQEKTKPEVVEGEPDTIPTPATPDTPELGLRHRLTAPGGLEHVPGTFTLPLRPRPDGGQSRSSHAALSPQTALLASPGISIEDHDDPSGRFPHPRSAPPDVQHFSSPLRHHRRTPSAHRQIKETLDARSEYADDDEDGRTHHRVNQYIIKEEIGRGSYGSVHLAVDQFGQEYAVKQFSKSRLRKHAQSNILRHGPRQFGAFPARAAFGASDLPTNRFAAQRAKEAEDALYLIREEIAIMKKLNHPNLVQLIEVLNDPEEDTLYMVLEMCKKGVVMKVGLGQTATPYPGETCRHWFRDLILGIEYLHSQGVVHRDIKPDNLLLTDDDVLKVVDFGVSELFETAEDPHMRTAKPAGSPAFLPPEMCVPRHGDIAGKAADIWSMGVSLYCLRYGRIPFEHNGVLEIYEAIRTQDPEIPDDENPDFRHLMGRILEKDPEKRITMAELREHPWVTMGGKDPLLSTEENCTDIVDPNPLEVNHAFTRRITHLMCVMKAIKRFKSLLGPKDALGVGRHAVRFSEQGSGDRSRGASGTDTSTEKVPQPVESTAEYAARLLAERALFLQKGGKASLGIFTSPTLAKTPFRAPGAAANAGPGASRNVQAPLLGIGTGGIDDFAPLHPTTNRTPSSAVAPAEAEEAVVSDSPTAVDFNIYDRAFEAEVERIKRSTSVRKGSANKGGSAPAASGHGPARKGTAGGVAGAGTLYHTRFNERTHYRTGDDQGGVVWAGGASSASETPRTFLAGGHARGEGGDGSGGGAGGNRLAELVEKAMRAQGQQPENSSSDAPANASEVPLATSAQHGDES